MTASGFRACAAFLPRKATLSAAKFAKIETLSRLLVVALAELRRCEKASRVEVNMNRWFEVYDDVCRVCLAGAVMRGIRLRGVNQSALPVDYCISVVPNLFDRATAVRMSALNAARCGDLCTAVNWMGPSSAARMHEIAAVQDELGHVPDYGADRDGWWAAMRKAVRLLRKIGE